MQRGAGSGSRRMAEQQPAAAEPRARPRRPAGARSGRGRRRPRDQPVPAGRQDADHQGDADGIVGTGLALSRMPRRVPRSRGPRARRRRRPGRSAPSAAPTSRAVRHEAEQQVADRRPARRRSRRCRPRRARARRRRRRTAPADVHAAVEQDHDQGNGHDPLVGDDVETRPARGRYRRRWRRRPGTAAGRGAATIGRAGSTRRRGRTVSETRSTVSSRRHQIVHARLSSGPAGTVAARLPGTPAPRPYRRGHSPCRCHRRTATWNWRPGAGGALALGRLAVIGLAVVGPQMWPFKIPPRGSASRCWRVSFYVALPLDRA